MNMKTVSIFFLFMCICVKIDYSQINESITSRNIFVNPPDSIPKIFAKGIISIQDRDEYGVSISPDYNEIFFTAGEPSNGLFVMRKLEDGNWSIPETANLRGSNSYEFEAFYTKDGRYLYFSSFVNDTSSLWSVSLQNGKWSNPKLLDSPINNTPVFWATFTNNNTMYYTNISERKIFYSQLNENQYKKTEDAGLPFGIHPYISSDESFMLFNAKGDIYVAFSDKERHWSEPVKLMGLINTVEYLETCPSLSPDEKYLFFSRYNDINKKSDIYWISSSVIENTRRIIFNN